MSEYQIYSYEHEDEACGECGYVSCSCSYETIVLYMDTVAMLRES